MNRVDLRFSIVIPSYNREDAAYDAVQALAQIPGIEQGEIVLVDQSGYDANRLSALCGTNELQIVRLNKPNLPRARNAGARAARGEILLFIDDDASPEAGWIENHLEHYIDTHVGCVAGRVQDRNAKGVSPVAVTYDPKSGEYHTDFGCQTPQETISVPGVNFSTRRSAWQKVKFDPAYRKNAYFEEVDYCFRLRKRGWRIQYEPRAVVRHALIRIGGCRFDGLSEIYYRFRNYALFHFRHGSPFFCLRFFKREKGFAEFISRKEGGGHAASRLTAAVWGTTVGGLLGMLKKWFDLLHLS